MDSELKYIHVVWIPAIPAGMTGFETLVYNDERWSVGTIKNIMSRRAFFVQLSEAYFVFLALSIQGQYLEYTQ